MIALSILTSKRNVTTLESSYDSKIVAFFFARQCIYIYNFLFLNDETDDTAALQPRGRHASLAMGLDEVDESIRRAVMTADWVGAPEFGLDDVCQLFA